MGRIVAISGGDLITTEPLNKYALELTKKKNPRVLFVPTASRDSEKYIKDFTSAFEKLNCSVKSLNLVRQENAASQIDKLLDWANMIYVGGGNAVFMMNTWKKVGLDKKLKGIFDSDHAVLSGNGAGCVCWFNCGYSNSEFTGGGTDWQYVWADGLLDIHHTAVCPHYNEEGRKGFDKRLMEKGIPGFAIEDNVAFVQEQDQTDFIKTKEDAKAYYMIYIGGRLTKQEIDIELVE